MPNILAIIPARGGSKSIPMKNLEPLAGKPLITYSIEVGHESQLVSRLIVSTDSERIRKVAVSAGAEVPFMRPKDLAADDTPDLPVFIHALEWLKENENYVPDVVVHLRPTTPLRRANHVDEAIKLLLDDPTADSVRSVSPPLQNPFKMWTKGDRYLAPLINISLKEPYNQPRQALPQVYWQTGYLDIIRTSTLVSRLSMTGDRVLPYFMDHQFVVDIDQYFSLKLAEFLLSHEEY